jgi:hypothetical protein
MGFSPSDVTFVNEHGVSQLNPLYAARLAERISFDGDIPELRFGPLPEGGRPAIPIANPSMNLVILGAQLRTASMLVRGQLQEAQEELNREVVGSSALRRHEGIGHVPARIQGYEPGLPAHPIVVDPQRCEVGDKQDLVHQVLSSTQGRQSMSILIGKSVSKRLGVSLGRGRVKLGEESVVYGLPEAPDVNPDFPWVDNTAMCLVAKVKRMSGIVAVEVVPLQWIHLRRIGWSCIVWGS